MSAISSLNRGAIGTAGAGVERGGSVERGVPVLNIAWAELLLQSLAHAGVREVVVSPGSRSTPLALAADASTALRAHFIVDERTAGFFALGQARVTGRPTVLVCTSGTACAHYFPALIEASMSGVPMIVLTADRPWELQQTGASQTIDQTRLFGSFVRMFAALGAPEPSDGALRAVARTAAQAVAKSLGPEPGPVHVNVPFRKPLEPGVAPGRDGDARLHREPWMATWEALMSSGPARSGGGARSAESRAVSTSNGAPSIERAVSTSNGAPSTERAVSTSNGAPSMVSAVSGVTKGGVSSVARAAADARHGAASSHEGLVSKAIELPSGVDPEVMEEIARIVAGAERGVIVCGPAAAHGDVEALRRAIGALAVETDFAIFAEATSQVRFGLAAEEGGSRVISAFDALLRSGAFRRRFAPDVIVEIGAPPVSAGYAQLLASAGSSCRRIVVTPLGWTDPMSSASFVVNANALSFCRALRAYLPGVSGGDLPGASGADLPASVSGRSLPGASGADLPASVSGRSLPGVSGADLPASVPFVSSFGGALAAADARARELIEQAISTPVLSEGAVARAVIDSCPAGSVLVLGNSSPVRDSDTYSFASSKSLCVLHQRGAAGIDGLVSGAAGAHSVSEKSVTLLLGDLSLLHDIGGLALARALPGVGAVKHASSGAVEHASDREAKLASSGDLNSISADAQKCHSGPVGNYPSGGAENVSGGNEERQSGSSCPLVIVVVNNGGGRIFEQLPIGRALGAGETFERCFATPQDVDFQAAAQAFGIAFERVTSLSALESALARAHRRDRIQKGSATLVEAVVPAHDGAQRIQDLWARIDRIFQDRKEQAS